MKKKTIKILSLICVFMLGLSLQTLMADDSFETPKSVFSDDEVTAAPTNTDDANVKATLEPGVTRPVIIITPDPDATQETIIYPIDPTEPVTMPEGEEDSNVEIQNSDIKESIGTGTTVAPQTGDSSKVGLLSVFILASFLVIVSCFRKFDIKKSET